MPIFIWRLIWKILGLRLVYQTGGIRRHDDPSLPYRLEMIFSPPEFMEIAFLSLYGGSEEFIVQAKSRKSLDIYIKKQGFMTHPRLRKLTITGPKGVELEHTGSK